MLCCKVEQNKTSAKHNYISHLYSGRRFNIASFECCVGASLDTRRPSEYHAREREVDLGQLWQVRPFGWRRLLSGDGRAGR